MSNNIVLVVEDHPLIRMSALELVENAGFQAIGVANADEAIAIMESRQDIAIVFTDVEMPGSMDGLKLAHYIKNRWPPVHLIIASGRAMPQEHEMPPGSRFFSKPYHDNAIIEALESLLLKSSETQQHSQ